MLIPLTTRNIISVSVFMLITTLSGHGQVQLEPACAESVQQYGVTGLDNSSYYWYFDHRYGQITEGDGTDTVTIQWGYPTGTVELEVLEVTNSNCSNNPSKAEVEIIAPDINLGNAFPEICQGDTLVLDAGDHYEEPYEISWSNGSNAQEYLASTSEEIWVHVIDGYGCSRYDTVSLLVNPLPVLNLRKDSFLCENDPGWVIDPGDYSTYNWTFSFNDLEENGSTYTAYPPEDMILDSIFLTVFDYNNCSASDTVIIKPCEFEVLLKDIPNTITPNNDGDNDVWNIPYMNLFDDAVLEIFDRWGRLVYRTSNVLEEPWDGTSKGRPLPMDSYYYVLDLNMLNASPLVGTVNLIR